MTKTGDLFQAAAQERRTAEAVVDARLALTRLGCVAGVDLVIALLEAQREADAVATCAACRAGVAIVTPGDQPTARCHEFVSGIRMPCAGELIRSRPLAIAARDGGPSK